MKILGSLVAILGLVGSSAFAAYPPVSFEQFEKVARDSVSLVQKNPHCAISMEPSRDGFSVRIKDSIEDAELFVSKSDSIELSSRNDVDGSFFHIYFVKNKGYLEFSYFADTEYRLQVYSSLTTQVTSCSLFVH